MPPRGDIGCRPVGDFSSTLLELAQKAEQGSKTLAGVLVQTPFSIALSISPARLVIVYDSHCHGTDNGALIVRGKCNAIEGSDNLARHISELIRTVHDCHMCLLWLKILGKLFFSAFIFLLVFPLLEAVLEILLACHPDHCLS